jgi:hypothetical protein
MAIGAWIMWKRKMHEERLNQEKANKEPEVHLPAVSEILLPASLLSTTSNKIFYTELRQCIWNYFSIYFNLRGSNVSRQSLRAAMTMKQVDPTTQQTLLDILQECETGMFTDVDMEMNREDLLTRTEEVLTEIHTG